MQRHRLFVAAVVLIVGMARPSNMFGQDNSSNETYEGVPVCRNARGVYPHPTYQPAPEYDDKARKKKTQGVVTLSIIVTTEGRTADIKVTKSLTPGLDQQAIKSVSRWTFEPVMQDGRACPMRVPVEVQFRLY
jgi:TonB family protein